MLKPKLLTYIQIKHSYGSEPHVKSHVTQRFLVKTICDVMYEQDSRIFWSIDEEKVE